MRYDEVAYVDYKGVKISNICYSNVKNIILKIINDKQRGYICLTDVSNLIAATKNEQQRAAVNDSLLSLADGTPLVWYAWMAGCQEIERISGASLMQRLLTDMDRCKHYLLGDTEHTITKVIAAARKLNHNVNISGHSPPFKEFDAEDNRQIIEKIRQANPDIIWVSFGGMKQEKWMRECIGSLDRGVMIGVGAAFRFLIGEIYTPPPILQKMGLQWLFRLADEFRRSPRICMKKVHEREILKSKINFLIDLPHEVRKCRRRLGIINAAKDKNSAV